VFADGIQLFETQLSVSSGVVNVHVSLPPQTKTLKILIKQINGANGAHYVVFPDARLSTGGLARQEGEIDLEAIGRKTVSGSFYLKEWWYYKPFQDKDGNIMTSAIGAGNDDSYNKAEYNIDQMGFNIFETKLSLDSKWLFGDYGKTAVGIYADDYKIYEKQFSSYTPVQKVRVKIPKGTKKLYLVTVHDSGAKGRQRVIFINPVLKKTSETTTVVPRNSNIDEIGASNFGNYSIDGWSSGLFQNAYGELVTSGIGFGGDGQYYSAYADYNIGGMNFNTFTANLSLDSKWINGDYGKTTIFFYANGKLFYSQSVSKSTGVKSLFLHLPINTTKFKIEVKQKAGALGNQKVILANAQFRYYSYTPNLSTTQLKATNNTGKKDVVTISKVQKGDTIKIYNSAGKLLASPKATSATVTVYLPQIGPKSGKLYIAAKRGTYLDSAKTAVSFGGEKTSTSKLKKVAIKNNKKNSDTITVSGLQKYDTVYVYNTRGTIIASKQASASTTTIYVKQLGKKKSYVYLAVRGSGMTTSSKVKVSFKSE
jgi:hypothetical protein